MEYSQVRSCWILGCSNTQAGKVLLAQSDLPCCSTCLLGRAYMNLPQAHLYTFPAQKQRTNEYPPPRDWKPSENYYLKNTVMLDSYHWTRKRQGTSSQAKMPFWTRLGFSQAYLTAECSLWTAPAMRLTTVLKRGCKKEHRGCAVILLTM